MKLVEIGKHRGRHLEFYYPHVITIREDKMKVKDSWNHMIQKVSTQGIFLTKFGSEGLAIVRFIIHMGLQFVLMECCIC